MVRRCHYFIHKIQFRIKGFEIFSTNVIRIMDFENALTTLCCLLVLDAFKHDPKQVMLSKRILLFLQQAETNFV